MDLHADVSKLDILYDDINLKENHENLKFISLRITNTGTETIFKSNFDENAPLGFKIINGRLVEKPELLSSSNEYISSHIQFSIDSSGAYFSPIIIICFCVDGVIEIAIILILRNFLLAFSIKLVRS